MELTLKPGKLTIADIKQLLIESTSLKLDAATRETVKQSEAVIEKVLADGKTVYGINTGFGALAATRIDAKDLKTLQRSIVLSHATGTGEYLSDKAVRLILALKINSLARGFSGIRLETLETLVQLYNMKIYPCIPCQGSVGASGDLAPLAHLCTILLGVGEARHKGKVISAAEALKLLNKEPLALGPKEGLALLNGTQASTALALLGLFAAENVFVAGLTAGALSVDAARGSDVPFDDRIQQVRGHAGQIQTAAWLREMLQGSQIRNSHRECNKIQDPYSLRCQPQVMGACLTQILNNADILLVEANAVSDNPLIFTDRQEILSGGNFHAEPVALAADALAVSMAEIGSISERRTALLVDAAFSGLPAFLVKNPGLNSGFMMAQVTAAALASENKSLAHPASVDSLPTSANQEDHVSMATYAARRLLPLSENVAGIVAIELLAACQGIDFLKPLATSPLLQKIHQLVRKSVSFYEQDRYFAPDIESIKSLVHQGIVKETIGFSIL